MNRLATREKRLMTVRQWQLESELKSELSRQRRCERKSRQRLYPLVTLLILLVAVAAAVAVDASFGEATGIVLCLFVVAIIAVFEEIRRARRRD